MKILYICTYYHRAMVFRDSMNQLEAAGDSVFTFNAVAKGAKVDEKYRAIMDDKVCHSECFSTYDRFFYFRKQRKIEKALCKSVDAASFDVVHSHTLFNGGWVALQLKRKYGIPYAVSVRNTDLNAFLKFPFFKGIARTIAGSASAVMFLSEAYRKRFLEKCFSAEEAEELRKKCYVIPNGLEPFWLEHIYEPRAAAHEPLSLLCVGKIDRNKNIETTADALDELNRKGLRTRLTVIGQVLSDDVLQRIEKNPNVEIVSYLKKEELIGYYRKADIFVMPSFNESFGRVYAEAMTQGLPVIYTRGQGFDEIFPRGTVGYDVDPRSSGEIAAAVEAILRDYGRISADCIGKCRVFDWKIITKNLREMYQNAVNEGK